MQYLCLNADVQTLSHFPSRKACRGEFCLFLVDKPTDLIAGNSDHNAVFVLEHWRSNFSVTEDPNFRHGKLARFWWTSPLVVLPEIWTIMMQHLCLNVGVRFLFRHGRFHRPLRKVWSSLVDKPIGFIAWNFDHIAVFCAWTMTFNFCPFRKDQFSVTESLPVSSGIGPLICV